MVKVSTLMPMVQFTMASGNMTSNMDMEQNIGLMVLTMMDSSLMEIKRVRVYYTLLMGQYMKVSFNLMKFMDLEGISGVTEKNMLDNGRKTE